MHEQSAHHETPVYGTADGVMGCATQDALVAVAVRAACAARSSKPDSSRGIVSGKQYNPRLGC